MVSGLGKGVTASSIGVLLKACGHRVTSIKIDPYLNVDAGTMSPFEHGEVFVLDDGGEVREKVSARQRLRSPGSGMLPVLTPCQLRDGRGRPAMIEGFKTPIRLLGAIRPLRLRWPALPVA